jgi:hypothetical protein
MLEKISSNSNPYKKPSSSFQYKSDLREDGSEQQNLPLKVWESERQLQDFDEEFNKIFNTS